MKNEPAQKQDNWHGMFTFFAQPSYARAHCVNNFAIGGYWFFSLMRIISQVRGLHIQETKSDMLKSLWFAYFKIADSKYFRLIVLWAFEFVSLFNRQFDPRLIKSLLCWIVSWKFKFYGLCHLIVKLQLNVIETNLYDWKVLNAQQCFYAIVFT